MVLLGFQHFQTYPMIYAAIYGLNSIFNEYIPHVEQEI